MEMGKVYTVGSYEYMWTGLGYMYRGKGNGGWKHAVQDYHLEVINDLLVDTIEEW